MTKQCNTEENRSYKKGVIIVVSILILNALIIFLLGRYALYPITDISDLRELSSDVKDMKVIRKTQRNNILMIVYEGENDEHYIITLEENFHGGRYRVLSSGSYALEQEPPISVNAHTLTGLVQYKLGEKYQLLSYTQFNAPTYKAVGEKFVLAYSIVCVAELIIYALIKAKKKK